MIKNNIKISYYLESLINDIFKILPLYEEDNIGINTYIESLLFDLDSYEDVIDTKDSAEYIKLMLTLTSMKKEIAKDKDDSKHHIIKREVFKCINLIKNMVGKLEGE